MEGRDRVAIREKDRRRLWRMVSMWERGGRAKWEEKGKEGGGEMVWEGMQKWRGRGEKDGGSDKERASREDQRGVQEQLLLIGGVEPNPGPYDTFSVGYGQFEQLLPEAIP